MKRLSLYLYVIFLFIVISTGSLLYAKQDRTPITREDFITEIKEFAARHVSNNTPLQTQVIINLYSKNPVELRPIEIAQIYENEYIRLKRLKENSLLEKLRPTNGWIVAAFFAILFIFGDFIKKKISYLIQIIWNYFYKKLAGNRLLRGISLRKYHKAVILKYSKLKLPFRPDRQLNIHDIYVPLKMTGIADKRTINVHEILTEKEHRHFVILGQPGSGKSMLLRNIALTYADGKLIENNNHNKSIPVLIELHRFNDPKLTLQRCLVEEFERNDFPNADVFVSKNLERGTLLLLFDGLDEVNSDRRAHIIQNIKDFLLTNQSCRSFITCREVVYKGELANITDQTLEIVKFTDQQISKFLCSWMSDIKTQGKSVEQLMLTLRDRPRIMALARNPLMLTIIAYLYSDTEFALPHSRTEFYIKATDILLDLWHPEHNHYRASDKRQVLQQLSLVCMDEARKQLDHHSINDRNIINLLRGFLPTLNLNPEKDVRPLLNEIIERSGLLISIDNGEKFQFAHPTLQEYFAAAAMKDDYEGLLSRWMSDPLLWLETVKLWCGLDIDSTSLISQIFHLDPLVAFECLADAQKVDQEVADEIIHNLKSKFEEDINNERISNAFASVAADIRSHGNVVLSFLEEMVSSEEKPSVREFAAYSLSLTNMPRAAQILARYYKSDPKIRDALVRMGDLAVHLLSPLAQEGSLHAIYDLYSIGTLQAIMGLVPILWHNKKEVATYAAMLLATFLSRSDVEDGIRNYPLSTNQKEDEWINWLWKPFSEPAESAIPIIAGRIAFLISKASGNTIDMIDQELTNHLETYRLELDPKIVIPVCTILLHPKDLTTRTFLLRFLLNGLSDRLKRRVDNLLSSYQKVSIEHWVNFQKTDYNFATSWIARLHKIIVIILTLIAVGYLAMAEWQIQQLFSWNNSIVLMCSMVIVLGCIIVLVKNSFKTYMYIWIAPIIFPIDIIRLLYNTLYIPYEYFITPNANIASFREYIKHHYARFFLVPIGIRISIALYSAFICFYLTMALRMIIKLPYIAVFWTIVLMTSGLLLLRANHLINIGTNPLRKIMLNEEEEVYTPLRLITRDDLR